MNLGAGALLIPVDLAPVPDLDDFDGPDGIIDRINNPVIPLPSGECSMFLPKSTKWEAPLFTGPTVLSVKGEYNFPLFSQRSRMVAVDTDDVSFRGQIRSFSRRLAV